ncbi:MAG TPA: YidC/Oxa1 family membrane protein insertase [Thermomicrobiales bacterium]|jgi:YidC/Oxa1 family membrane protein insertase
MFNLELYGAVTIPLWGQFVDILRAVLTLLISLTGSPGLAIILFTVAIRALLIPLTLYSHRANQRTQALRPKLEELQRRYRHDRQKLSAETMRLYHESRINPYATVLPTVIQIPLLLGLYQAITAVAATGRQGFLWLPSLAHADPWHLLPFAAALFQLVQARMALPSARGLPLDAQQQIIRQLTQVLPLTALAFGWVAAAGLALYWATQAAFGAVQQYFLTGWGALCDWFPLLPGDRHVGPPA